MAFVVFMPLVLSCGRTQPLKTGITSYRQDFKTDMAWISLEWNGKLYGYGSGFLVDKEKGAFYTNKHVSDMFNTLGNGSHKIFFNGKVYNASIVKVLPLVDAALIKITDKFDPFEFPEPVVIATEKPDLGDLITIQGFHVHPHSIREWDKSQGFDYPIVPILDDYYHMGTKNLNKERQIVFEQLYSVVLGVDVKYDVQFDDSPQSYAGLREEVNRYIYVKTFKNHMFSFGGLSGSAARNAEGKVMGIVTRQNPKEFVVDDDQTDKMGGYTVLKQVFTSIYITPIESVDNLREYLK